MFNTEELKFIRSAAKPFTGTKEAADSVVNKIDTTLSELVTVNENLYKFYWYCGRSGELEGLFKATKEDVDRAIGCEVYFGEVLGKHSEVYGTLKEGEIKLESDDPLTVLKSVESGFNPLEYIRSASYFTVGMTSSQLRGWCKDWQMFSDDMEDDIEDMDEKEMCEYFTELLDGEGCADEYECARDEWMEEK